MISGIRVDRVSMHVYLVSTSESCTLLGQVVEGDSGWGSRPLLGLRVSASLDHPEISRTAK